MLSQRQVRVTVKCELRATTDAPRVNGVANGASDRMIDLEQIESIALNA